MIKSTSKVFKAKPITNRKIPVICRAKPSQKHEIEASRALSIACAIAIVSTSLVLIATAREFNLDLEKSNQEYIKLQHMSRQLSTLQKKQVEDEMLLNALTEEIIKLRQIGVV